MHHKYWDLLVFIFALWSCVEAACGPSLTTTVDLSAQEAPKIIKWMTVDSVYPFTVTQGDKFQIVFTGTDVGEAYLVAGSANSTLSIGKKPEPPSAGPASSKPTISAAQRTGLQSLLNLIGVVCGIFVLGRSTTKGSYTLALAILGLSCVSFISTAVESDCNITAQIVIPSGKIQNVCDLGSGDCVCGTDYSGAYCNYYKAKCIPTPQQIANRFNYPDAFAPADIPLPEPGESFCDNNFGSEIWRVSNRVAETNEILINQGWVRKNLTETTDQRIGIVGTVGFSVGNRYLMVQGDVPYVYEVNMDEYDVPHINPNKRIYAGLGHETNSAFFNYVTTDINGGAWMTDRHYVFNYAGKIFSIDYSQERNERGGRNVTFIGDLAPYLANNYYAGPLNDIGRCTSSRRRADGSIRIACAVAYNVGTLPPPDANKIDSHYPNATCVNAQYFNGAYGRVGYILFDVMSATPTQAAVDDNSNVKLYYKWVNGVESDEWYCFQSTLQWSSELNDHKLWIVFNGNNNGYKFNMDRSGQWISSAVSDNPQTLGWDIGKYINPTVKIKLRPTAEGGGVVYSVIHGYEGHGALGWEESMIQSTAPDPCGSCIGYLKFDKIVDDDPNVYVGTNQIGPMFNGNNSSPWRYNILGLYGSYFHATPNSKGEGVMQGSCDANYFDCGTIPRGAEVFRITPDPNSFGGTIERIASTRDGWFTLYAIITSECEDPPAPCWAAFQSTWKRPRRSYDEVVPSDIFIVRFR